MSDILFTEIPSNQQSPAIFTEIDPNTGAVNPSQIDYQVLAIGQMTSEGSATAETVIQITGIGDAVAKFGEGSHIASMAEVYFDSTPTYPMYAIALADASGAVAATGTIAFTGTATESGTHYLYIGGVSNDRRITTGITTGDAATDIATAVAASINAAYNCPVTAVAATGTITLTARNAGTLGNKIPIFENLNTDEETPSGVTTVITAMSGGATDPDVQDALDAIPEDDWYHYIIGGYTAAVTVLEIETYLAEKDVATKAKSGVYWAALNSTSGISELTTYGSARNSTHSSIMGMYNNPSLPWDFAAAIVAAVAPKLGQRASYNLSGTEIPFVGPSIGTDMFENSEQNQLLATGISTYNRTTDGKCTIDKLITTYQTNSSGGSDDHYRAVQSFYTMQYLRYDVNTFLAAKYQNFNIVDDGSKYAKGAKVTTPNGIKASLQNRAITWAEAILIEDVETTIANAVVERNSTNTNRVDWRLEVNLANQLEVLAGQIGFQV